MAVAEREVLITEVTRMGDGIVCVAGIDVATDRVVRPLQGDGSNWEEGEWVQSGLIAIGNVLLLRPVASSPKAALPHGHEDTRVDHVTVARKASPAELYDACRRTADPSLESIVGDTLVEGKYIKEGTDCRSLGCLMMDGSDLRFSGKFGKVQVSWRDEMGVWHNLKLTDLATSQAADTEAEAKRLEAAAMFADGAVALRIGLARAWVGPNGDWNPKRCTLQLNGLVFPA